MPTRYFDIFVVIQIVRVLAVKGAVFCFVVFVALVVVVFVFVIFVLVVKFRFLLHPLR